MNRAHRGEAGRHRHGCRRVGAESGADGHYGARPNRAAAPAAEPCGWSRSMPSWPSSGSACGP